MATRFGPAPLFLFFTIMMVLQLLWVLFKMPETKGVPLEQLEAKLFKKSNDKQDKLVRIVKAGLEIK